MQAGLNFLKCAFLCSGPPNAWFYDVLDMIGRKRPSTPTKKKKKKKKKNPYCMQHMGSFPRKGTIMRKLVRANHFSLPNLSPPRTTFGCQKWSELPKVNLYCRKQLSRPCLYVVHVWMSCNMKATEGSKKRVHTIIEQHTNQHVEIVCEEERGTNLFAVIGKKKGVDYY